MTNEQVKKFIQAANDAGLTKYQFDTDLGTRYHHDGINNFIVHDEANSMLYNARSGWGGSTPVYGEHAIYVMGADLADVHECRVGGDYDKIKTLFENLGITLTEEQKKVLLNINNKNYSLKPETGDYQNVQFKVLTSSEVIKLSEEDRAKYLEDFKNYQESNNKLSKSIPAQITV